MRRQQKVKEFYAGVPTAPPSHEHYGPSGPLELRDRDELRFWERAYVGWLGQASVRISAAAAADLAVLDRRQRVEGHPHLLPQEPDKR